MNIKIKKINCENDTFYFIEWQQGKQKMATLPTSSYKEAMAFFKKTFIFFNKKI
jgi:predicted solute-binding protein